MAGNHGVYEWDILETGENKIMSKATNSNGQSQPTIPFWNKKAMDITLLMK
ncbi:hypothetical protein [Bacillus salacetis]|uniref:hypothetical protein n=1 Tax=Bacillus salacetis TaxID=2315464 RepID=UPI001F0BBDF5|nr:hypothetical protein [Bacillus salacetis]